MRFKVPQFIEIEDKIFGPFTWRQFLYLGGGIGMAIAFFLISGFLFVLIGIPLAALAGALAFYSVNNRPFASFLESLLNYFTKQRLYLWRKKTDAVHTTFTPAHLGDQNSSILLNQPNVSRPEKGITSLSRKLELQALQKTE
ncbi:MAG: hypothetical protein ACI9BF_000198 [Candidatus Paceibacteria bacterium]|jgi:hypothetical protein